jgi:hypothetical protein
VRVIGVEWDCCGGCISGVRVTPAMLARHSTVVVSRGITCCIRRAHCPKRSSFALLPGRPGGGGGSATVLGSGIGSAAVRRGYFRAGAIAEARMAGGGTGGGGGSASHKHTNRLAREHSPYLLQHAHNPVRVSSPLGDRLSSLLP